MKIKDFDDEFEEYILCSEIYHCTPSQIEKEDYNKTKIHYAIYNIIQEKAKKEKLKNNKSKNGNR